MYNLSARILSPREMRLKSEEFQSRIKPYTDMIVHLEMAYGNPTYFVDKESNKLIDIKMNRPEEIQKHIYELQDKIESIKAEMFPPNLN